MKHGTATSRRVKRTTGAPKKAAVPLFQFKRPDEEREHRPPPKFKSALRIPNLADSIRSLDPDSLPAITHAIRRHLSWAVGDPTEAKIRDIHQDCEILGQLIDFNLVVARLKLLDQFHRSAFGVSFGEFFPELSFVYDEVAKVIFGLPKSTQKTENWLEPIAREAGADADIEATVYFASRGRTDLVEPSTLRGLWHRAVCYEVTRGVPVGKVPKDVLARANDFTLPLSEAADVLQFNGELPRFFSFRDQEEDFIDAAFFRAIEWLNVTGFDRWLNSLIRGISAGPQYGLDHCPAGWWLFHWCRSSLALRTAERPGLEAWLWALINGPIQRDKPWVTFFAPPNQDPRYRDYIPLAGIIPFVWHRISPQNMKDEVIAAACRRLLESQTQAGGWPLYGDQSDSCVLTTCAAIHGLALAKPRGWEHAAEKGAHWLLSQQSQGGHWEIGGGPPVMLSVLVLDSICLGYGTDQTTFRSPLPYGSARHDTRPALLDYSKQRWFTAPIPKIKVAPRRIALRRTKPALGIVVATDTELRAALKRLRPCPGLTAVWEVPHGSDTFYIGRFGAFETVVMLCSPGTHGANGSTLAADSLIRTWRPKAVLMAGIAFGADRKRQAPGDVIVAQSIIPYEIQRVGDTPIFRNPVPSAGEALLNRFRNTLNWEFLRPDGTKCKVHFGLVLSGEKLIDNEEFKQSLLNNFPAALGGEMEGAGLWASAVRHKTEWLLVKGVCDWADGRKNDDYQAMAAAAALSLCERVLEKPQALAGM